MQKTLLVPILITTIAAGVALPAAAQPQSTALAFEVEGLDLETGTVIVLDDLVADGDAPNADRSAVDFSISANPDRATLAVVFQAAGAEIAVMPDTPFAYVGSPDVASLTFTSELIDSSCDGDDTVMIRTVGGSVYKVGNFLEDPEAGVVLFDYELLESPQAALAPGEPGDALSAAARAVTAASPRHVADRGLDGQISARGLPAEAHRAIARHIELDLYGIRRSAVAGAGQAPLEGGNPAQAYSTRFTDEGIFVRPRGAEVELGLTLVGWGSGTDLPPVPPAPPRADGQRVDYVRGALTEWYVNRSSGLEQGFTLNAPPPGSAGEEPLRVELAISGPLVAEASDDSVLFRDADGTVRLRYGGLVAWDATGRELTAEMVLADNSLALEVDGIGARYPVTIDPTIINEDAKLVASQGAAEDRFGFSVAVDGDTVVVGAPSFTNQQNGAAYVFEKPVGGWVDTLVEGAKLLASDGLGGDRFGRAVAISGDTIVVASPSADDLGNRSGKAYVFAKPLGGWTGTLNEDARLFASDGGVGDFFGISVAVLGDTVVAGARAADGVATTAGSAYIFEQPVGGWSGTLNEDAKLVASDGDNSDFFGVFVGISGDTVVAGAALDDDNGTNSGSAYVFTKPAAGWAGTLNEDAKLGASDPPRSRDEFGTSVAISGDTLAVGAPLDDDTERDAGSAYVFVEPAGGWTGTLAEDAKLLASDGAEKDQFGISVSASGDTIVVGAYLDDDGATDAGSAYIFDKPAGGWAGTLNEDTKLLASDGSADDQFGVSVSVSGSAIVVGAYFDDDGGTDFGSAYVFGSVVHEEPICATAQPVSVECGGATTMVGLDGSGLGDPGDVLSWTTDCLGGVFDDATSATPTLTLDSATPGVCATLSCTATLTVDDGQSEFCSETAVTVADTTAPAITPPGPLTLGCGLDTYSEPGATSSDACDPDVPVTVGGDVVDPSTPGIYTVTYDAVDDCGNAAQASRIVTVVDPQAPVITACAADRTLVVGVDGLVTVPDLTGEIEVAENCLAASLTQTPVATSALGAGVHPVTFTATDVGGNTATCIANLTVLEQVVSLEEEVKVHLHEKVDDDGDSDCFGRLELDGELELRDTSMLPIDLRGPGNLFVDARVLVSLAGVPISDQTLVLEVKDEDDEKWEYKRSGDPKVATKKLKIDWKEMAEYDSHEGTPLGDDMPQIESRFIGFDETDLKMKFKEVSRPFSVAFFDSASGGTWTVTILDDDGTVSISPAGSYDLDSHDDKLEIALPFRLTPATTITFDDGTTVTDYPVNPETNYVVAGAQYKLDFDRTAVSDQACLDGTLTRQSTPLLEVELRLGAGARGDATPGEQVVGGVAVGPAVSDWTKVDDKHWEEKP